MKVRTLPRQLARRAPLPLSVFLGDSSAQIGHPGKGLVDPAGGRHYYQRRWGHLESPAGIWNRPDGADESYEHGPPSRAKGHSATTTGAGRSTLCTDPDGGLTTRSGRPVATLADTSSPRPIAALSTAPPSGRPETAGW